MKIFIRSIVYVHVVFISFISKVWADTPEQVVNDFSTRSIEMLKGPVAKLLGAVILLAGVASLLRGRHKMAICCGIAFVMLLFLPILLGRL